MTPASLPPAKTRAHAPMFPTPPSRPPEWTGLSDRGRQRANNEDAWGVFALGPELTPLGSPAEEWPAHGVLFVLSDGMGGARAGEEASRFCVERLARELQAQPRSVEAGVALRTSFLATHAALAALGRANPEWHGLGATLSVLWQQPGGGLVLGHVGDSRIYGRHEGRWRQWTDDHTLGEGLVRRGGMTPEAAARFRFRSLLEQVMGGDGRSLDPQIVTARWQEGDAFALCSDGLYRPLAGEFARRLDAAWHQPRLPDGARLLVDAANAAGGPDNITVVLAGPPSSREN